MKSLGGGGQLQTDPDGNPILWVEASNPSPDITNEKFYPATLMDAKDYFLLNGNITFDHVPKRYPETGTIGYIGKPIDVQRRGDSVWVQFKLNRLNPIAKDIIQKISAGADFIRALRSSIGGMLNSARRTDVIDRDGSTIKQGTFLWNELAITYEPVNDTLNSLSLGGMPIAKSMLKLSSPSQIMKSLQASGVPFGAGATGVDAIINPSPQATRIANKLNQLIRDGTLQSAEAIKHFLMREGIPEARINQFLKEKSNGL